MKVRLESESISEGTKEQAVMSIRDSKGFYVYKNMVLIPEPLNLR
jgi:hypothetical protein